MTQVIQFNPADILANIPGTLGFYPHNSLVLVMALENNQDTNVLKQNITESTALEAPYAAQLDTSSSALPGPVIRLDIEDLPLVQKLGDLYEQFQPLWSAAFLIIHPGYLTKDRRIENLGAQLQQYSRSTAVRINACYTLNAIANHEPYHEVFFNEMPLQAGQALPQWHGGVVTPIRNAHATQQLLAHGELPELDREAALSCFTETNPNLSTKQSHQLLHTAIHKQKTVIGNLKTNTQQRMLELNAAIDAHQEVSFTDIMQDEHSLQYFAAWLGSTYSRDLCINAILADPSTFMRICLAVARSLPKSTVRSNALCMYALSALSLGANTKASLALTTAHHENPAHRLSDILMQAYRAGIGDKIVGAALAGAQETLQDSSTVAD